MQFEQELKKLNKNQRLAVETTEGPVMVVAGPGTGKTQVLTLRIANILKKTDTPPESVLALTFTESATSAMRKRLLEMMGAEAYKVSIKTIHGFCNEVIQNYPEEFKELSGATNITEVEQIRLVRKLLDGEYELLRSFGDPYRNVREIIGAISDLKRENVSPEEFVKIVRQEKRNFEDIEDLYHQTGKHKGEMKGKYQTKEKQLERLQELAGLYGVYQHSLRRSHSYDYDDMVMEVAKELKSNRALRYTLQEQYLYILVDEHQDTNSSQNQVIEQLASFHDSPNLFVVGDEKQAIYRFQGASVENFSYFQKRFKGAKLIALKDNYRSHQTILDAAFDIALKRGPLVAQVKYPPKPISVAALSEPDTEQYFIARDIQERIKNGVAPEQIAVLYRDNKDAAPISRMLQKLNVPFAINSDEDVLEDLDIQKLLHILESVRDFGADHALIPILYIDFLKIAPLDIALLLDASRKSHSSVFVLMRDKKVLERIVPESADKLFDLYKKLSLWKARSKNNNPVEVFEEIVRDSGFLADVTRHTNAQEKLAKLHTLFDEIKALVESKHETTLESFLEHLGIIREHRVKLSSAPMFEGEGGVRLMTAHKAKGLEFEYVYIIGAYDGHWGNRRNRDLFKLPLSIYSHIRTNKRIGEEDDGDERNLFYVALTRAKKEVVISYALKNAEGRDQVISEFANSIRPELVEKVNISKIEKEWVKNRTIEFEAPAKQSFDAEYKEFLKKRFKDRGLTVSALNNYLQCQNKFYFVNLVGIPESQNKFALFGNAVHEALRRMGQNKERVSKEQLVKFFNAALKREPIGERDFSEMLVKGKKVLGAYYDKYVKGGGKDRGIGKSLYEFPIDGVEVDGIPLRGRIDRIDIPSGMTRHTSEDRRQEVTVVDFKTGRVKTRNEIAGLTKDADGNFRRQLAFYALLLERGTKYRMKEGVIDFVEGLKQERFAVEQKEVKELEGEIKRVAGEILAGKFQGCREKDCRYCALHFVNKEG